MPPVVRGKFEQLTGLSSVLMEQGVYGVHSMSREALERSILREELAAQEGQVAGQQGEEGPGGDGRPPAEQPNGRGASPAAAAGVGDGEAADAGQALAERLLAAAAPAASNGQNGSATNGAGRGIAAAAAAAAAVDADQDIFAEEEEAPAAAASGRVAQRAREASPGQPSAQQQRGAVDAPAIALEPAGVERDGSGDVAMQDSQQPPVGAAAVQPVLAGAAAQLQGSGAAALQTAQQQQQPAPAPQQQQQQSAELEGFTRDPDSGWLYNRWGRASGGGEAARELCSGGGSRTEAGARQGGLAACQLTRGM